MPTAFNSGHFLNSVPATNIVHCMYNCTIVCMYSTSQNLHPHYLHRVPNQQRTLNKLPTELGCRNLVHKHRLSTQIGAKRATTCLQRAYILKELPFCIPPLVVGSACLELQLDDILTELPSTYHRWWLGLWTESVVLPPFHDVSRNLLFLFFPPFIKVERKPTPSLLLLSKVGGGGRNFTAAAAVCAGVLRVQLAVAVAAVGSKKVPVCRH